MGIMERFYSFDEMVREIEAYVMWPLTRYDNWRIGVTDDVDQRMIQHWDSGKGNRVWHYWPAASEDEARAVEHHFKMKGMQGKEGGRGHAAYVYIFLTAESPLME
jgi:predicted GIY-YIG superfamily endonuclease